MAKDPAMLWYWNDWHGGTVTFSRHLKGCYIDLLHAQFNTGRLSLEEVKTVLGNDFALWGTLSKKFAVDETGKYFNEKLEQEKIKREEFSKKQFLNGSKGGRPIKNNPWDNPNHNPNITLLENETEIENEIQDRGVQGGKDLTAIEIGNTVEFVFKMKQVRLTHAEVLNYWESFLLNEQEPAYYTREKKIRHFRNWVKNQIKNGSANTTTSNKPNKPGTSEARIAALKNWGTGTGA